MSPKRPRILLLQARRDGDPMAAHERQCFERCTEGAADITPHDLHHGVPALERVRTYDALMMGGAGDYYASKRNLPGHGALEALLQEVVEASHPTFCVCYGYHFLVQALGGEVVHDPANTEVGTFELELTPEGLADELIGQLPRAFAAQMGHKDRPEQHPAGIATLASSPRSAMQALRVPSRPVWGVQFHPELDRDTNLDRFDHYLASYAQYMSEAERIEARAKFQESPEASNLLRRFVALMFG